MVNLSHPRSRGEGSARRRPSVMERCCDVWKDDGVTGVAVTDYH